MARVLVTGAAGWLGSELVRQLLTAGDEPKCLVPPGKRAELPPKITKLAVEGDVRSDSNCAAFCEGGGDVLFHCAGVIHPRRVHEFREVNVAGTIRLLAAAMRASVRRAVVVSSNSPCGCNPHPGHIFDEDSPYEPYLGYGRSKMEMEQEVLSGGGAIERVLVRAPWFYGPGQPPRQSLFFRMIREGRVPVIGCGENMRSMAYVPELAEGLRLAGQAPGAAGRLYWMADERPYSWNEIIQTISDVLEKDFKLQVRRRTLRLPELVGAAAYAADLTLQALGLYNQKIHVLSEIGRDIACSIGRAKAELGFAPKVGLREGMRRSIDWCLRAGLAL